MDSYAIRGLGFTLLDMKAAKRALEMSSLKYYIGFKHKHEDLQDILKGFGFNITRKATVEVYMKCLPGFDIGWEDALSCIPQEGSRKTKVQFRACWVMAYATQRGVHQKALWCGMGGSGGRGGLH